MPSVIDRLQAVCRRPGIGSALVLLAAALVPTPGVGGHLLGLPTLCPFRVMTGLPCPGCGMTRALCCLCHGRFADALWYHPAVPLVVLGLAAAAVYGIATGKRLPERPVAVGSQIAIAACFAVWLCRMAHWLPFPPG